MLPPRWLCGCLLSLCFIHTDLSAQSIRGRLLDIETERPIASATVTLLGSDARAVRGVITDDAGEFVLQTGVGRFQLRAERIGYQTAVTPPLDLHRGDSVAVELRLSTDAVVLAPLTVTASPRGSVRNRTLDGFYARRARGRGRFFTPEQIERIRPVYVTNLLQMTPGVRLSYVRIRPQVTVGHGLRECVPALYVDGLAVPLGEGLSIDDWVSGSSVRALEVYRSRLEIPVDLPWFNNCGAILVWTDFGLGIERYSDRGSLYREPRRLLGVALWGAIAAGTVFVVAR